VVKALDYEVIERPNEVRMRSAKQNQSSNEGLHSCKALVIQATNKPQCHAGTRVPVWAGGVKLERQPKTCEARIANMRSMIGTSPRLERQIYEYFTIINFQFKEE
jgi:hypothetical protein